jgi:hypothetical protein
MLDNPNNGASSFPQHLADYRKGFYTHTHKTEDKGI